MEIKKELRMKILKHLRVVVGDLCSNISGTNKIVTHHDE